MTMKTIMLESPNSDRNKKKIPVTIKWQDAPMVRNHSIRSTVHEILQSSSRLGMVRINVIGASGTGKTSLAETIAHLCHTMSDIPYEVKFMQKADLVDFTATIKSLSSNNQCLIFDDLSWMDADFSKSQITKLKSEITTIRHIDGNTDRKVIMIFNTHAQKVMDKFLRICNFTYYSSCSSEEVTYLLESLGKKYSQKIDLFRRLRIQAINRGEFNFALGKHNTFKYKAFDPFLPYLFSNGDFTRFVVSPLRSWIDKDCQICEKVIESTKENIDEFVKDYSKKFGVSTAKKAVQLILMQHGINTQPKRTIQAQKYINQFLALKKINLEELAEKFGLEERTTKLFPDKQPEVST
jgi:hypothetical protein